MNVIFNNTVPIGRACKTQNFTARMPELDEIIHKTVKTMQKRAEFEVPEYGRLFKPVVEEMQNPDTTAAANRAKFTIKPSTEKNNQKGRILKMEVLSAKGNAITPIFECGSKEDILKILKDETLPEKIKDIINNANEASLKKEISG